LDTSVLSALIDSLTLLRSPAALPMAREETGAGNPAPV
jgi:hypothetical protein